MNKSGLIYLKLCPRCQGDIHVNRDMYGEYKECLQCGYMEDIDKPNQFAQLKAQPPRIDDVA